MRNMDSMWKPLEHLFDRAFRSLGAAFLVWAIAAFFNITAPPIALTALFLLCFGIYTTNRYTDTIEDQANQRLPANPHLYKWIGITSLLIALLLAIWFNVFLFFIMLIPLFVGFLYSIPLLPQGWKYQRIKQIPVLNTASVAASVSFLFIFSLYSFSNIPIPIAILLFLFFFLQAMIGTIIPNIADVKGDQKAGIDTLPILLGLTKTKQILYLLQTVSILLLLTGIIITILPDTSLIFCVIPLAGLPVIWKTTTTNAKTMELIHEFNVTYFVPLIILAWVSF